MAQLRTPSNTTDHSVCWSLDIAMVGNYHRLPPCTFPKSRVHAGLNIIPNPTLPSASFSHVHDLGTHVERNVTSSSDEGGCVIVILIGEASICLAHATPGTSRDGHETPYDMRRSNRLTSSRQQREWVGVTPQIFCFFFTPPSKESEIQHINSGNVSYDVEC